MKSSIAVATLLVFVSLTLVACGGESETPVSPSATSTSEPEIVEETPVSPSATSTSEPEIVEVELVNVDDEDFDALEARVAELEAWIEALRAVQVWGYGGEIGRVEWTPVTQWQLEECLLEVADHGLEYGVPHACRPQTNRSSDKPGNPAEPPWWDAMWRYMR
jgi:hypothetical protein